MEPIIADNLSCIDQAIDLLESLDDSVYARASEETLNAGVGGHIRHNIDHYESFLNRKTPAQIDYEDRERDASLECDPACARSRLQAIRTSFERLDVAGLDLPIEVKIENPGPEPDAQWATTTERRELQFLLSHTVHHYALIAMICRHHGVQTPPDFGVAPSTLRYRQTVRTA